ncbi:MAG: hypothetical protein WCS65_00020 [Verrucomicrobiae bacterium]
MNIRSLAAFSLLLCAAHLCAQAVGPGGAQEKPGIAMIKPQAWSKDDQATVLEFQAVSNRTGYYQFRTAKQPAYQVASSKVVSVILYPELPGSITTAGQRAALQKTLDEFAATTKKFPSAERLIGQAIDPLKADAAKYDEGNIKENGAWILRGVYSKTKAASLAALIKPEILAAPKIKDFDLATNHYFVGLKELSESEPSIRPIMAGVQSLYDSLVRKEERSIILQQLHSDSLSLDQAAALVAKLKTLCPQEEAAANLYIQSWDTATSKAEALTAQINEVQGRFETSVWQASASAPPSIAPELAASLQQMSESARQFRAGSPPPIIRVPLPLADAMSAFGENLPALAGQIKARELFEAKARLDLLVGQARLIGPKTSAALAEIRKQVNGDVGKFLVLRDEGKMLVDNQKFSEALKKYELAYEVVPSQEIAAQMDALKKQLNNP